jgi:hypothetical protein
VNDLGQISRLNNEAVERDIPNQQALGHYVVAEYHGLHFVGYTNKPTELEANQLSCRIGATPGCRARVFPPTQAKA